MNCKEVNESLLSYLDNEVSPQERESIENHLSGCPGCRKEMEALAGTQRELRQALESMTAGVSPSPNAWVNIRQQLAEEEQGKAGILSRLGAKLGGGIGALKPPRPVWQTLGALSVAVLVLLSLTLPSSPTQVADNQLTTFSSYSELKDFLKTNTQVNNNQAAVKGVDTWAGGAPESLSIPSSESGNSGDYSSDDYSTTNIQVEGVDEADIVKTDGEFIYVASDNRAVIARAYPAGEAQFLTEIALEYNIDGLFINGDRLVVIHQDYNNEDGFFYGNLAVNVPVSVDDPVIRTYIKVYDVSDKANPVLARDMSIDGNYFSSRMVGDYIYIIVNALADEEDDEMELPAIHLGGTDVEINATDIYYNDNDAADYYHSFTTIAAVNVKEDDREPEYETLLLGGASCLYVSQKNIYVASEVRSGNLEKTTIHRFYVYRDNIVYQASGEVPGRVLNQFSMDEYQGFFRVATTTGYVFGSFDTETSKNHLYTLDMKLDRTGSVEDLAPGEEIYSVRFMGNRAYIVTFRQVDPLFVIDVSDPYYPAVLGQLKVTGYSDYLHPYDEDHLIGIGKEATSDGLYQGIKISFFDVSDVNNPDEKAKYEIGDRGTESPVLDDHKALLFDRDKNLLVIPVLVMEGWHYTYQGAYVFHISPEEGINLEGTITHCEDEDDLQGSIDSPGESWVQRSLYIDNVLYTISDTKIVMNDLENLDQIGEIQLP